MAHHEDKGHPESHDAASGRGGGGAGGGDSAEGLALDAAVAESEDLRQKLIRLQADFQNFQRRSAKEILDARQWAEGDFAKSLITVLDHFDLATNVDPAKTDAATLLQGVKITYDELKKVLASRGIETFDPANQPFDPHLHEAVMQEANGDVPPMTVLQTFQLGYRLGERILRPAKVKVSKAAT
jgi:molecular chaperone GrpE